VDALFYLTDPAGGSSVHLSAKESEETEWATFPTTKIPPFARPCSLFPFGGI
jgi:hypothetical protein